MYLSANGLKKGDRLCRLYDEKSDTWERVEATTSGTVTAISAQNGAPANGVLFTIEDTNSLRVVTNIRRRMWDCTAGNEGNH